MESHKEKGQLFMCITYNNKQESEKREKFRPQRNLYTWGLGLLRGDEPEK